MQHIWRQENFGENWFSYPGVYHDFAQICPDGGSIVEVGSWKGRSAACMAVEIINTNKNINFHCVDTWEGSREHTPDRFEDIKNNTLYDTFIENIKPVAHVVKPMRMTSVAGSTHFADESIDIVFIDANHEYEGVKEDIEHWLPKVKHGGIISGHDYSTTWKGVVKAVDELIGKDNITLKEGAWIWKKQ